MSEADNAVPACTALFLCAHISADAGQKYDMEVEKNTLRKGGKVK